MICLNEIVRRPMRETPAGQTAEIEGDAVMQPYSPDGHGPAVRSDRSGLLRQAGWASMPVWSLGFLSFGPFLRLALARRQKKDWAICAAYIAAVVAVCVALSVVQRGNAAVGGLVIGLIGFATVHAAIAFRPPQSQLPETQQAQPVPRIDNRHAVADARNRIELRQRARELAGRDPVLARELRIGRPDLPRQYDDGGLIDVNTVPGAVLAAHLGLDEHEVTALMATRASLGKLTSADELVSFAELAPDRVDAIRDLLLFT